MDFKAVIVLIVTFTIIGILVYQFIRKLKDPNMAWTKETKDMSKKEKTKIILYALVISVLCTILMFLLSAFNLQDMLGILI